jgi:hypothetical protein
VTAFGCTPEISFTIVGVKERSNREIAIEGHETTILAIEARDRAVFLRRFDDDLRERCVAEVLRHRQIFFDGDVAKLSAMFLEMLFELGFRSKSNSTKTRIRTSASRRRVLRWRQFGGVGPSCLARSGGSNARAVGAFPAVGERLLGVRMTAVPSHRHRHDGQQHDAGQPKPFLRASRGNELVVSGVVHTTTLPRDHRTERSSNPAFGSKLKWSRFVGRVARFEP